jgi:hypothetical protein
LTLHGRRYVKDGSDNYELLVDSHKFPL